VAADLNFVHLNRGTKVKSVRQAPVLTYRTKPVPEVKYVYCLTAIAAFRADY
jgi:hypothetical protein